MAGIVVLCAVSGAVASDVPRMSVPIMVLLVAVISAGRHADDLRRLAAMVAAGIVVVDLLTARTLLDDWVFPAVLLGLGGAVGRGVRTRAKLVAALAERTERLGVERELRATEAAAEERRRIARELHDVVAHSLSVMVVQAGGARRVLDRDVPRAIEALETVEATGRTALTELRRLLGFVGELEAAPREPVPGLAGLHDLAARAGAAGLETTVGSEGSLVPLPAAAEVALYRIAQEALTNALKHGGSGTRAEMMLHWSPDAVALAVTDDGGTGHGARLPSGGLGLVGMRERVGLFGGTLEAGPDSDGGYRVRAVIPLRAAVPA